ncbi:MAG: cytochrome c oxidase subunit II [Microcoleaceae cyanobacterium]
MKFRLILTLSVVAIALLAVSLWMGQQAYTWLPPQASAESKLSDDLFSFLVTISTSIFFGVTGTLAYSLLFHRAGKYDFSDGPHIEGNVTLEVVWTAIPMVLVFWLAGYSYQVYNQMAIRGPMEHHHGAMAAAQAAPMNADPMNKAVSANPRDLEEIEVLSRQWAWEFRYPNQNITSTELHLPQDRRVRLTMTSEDVIHGFYIPAFRVKQDIIPGRVNDLEFTPIRIGQYRLRDSQYSGTYFAAMQTDVVVESREDYQQWLAKAASQTPTVAYNRAFTEYNQTQKSAIAGWKTVPPSAPPVVNFSSAKENSL